MRNSVGVSERSVSSHAMSSDMGRNGFQEVIDEPFGFGQFGAQLVDLLLAHIPAHDDERIHVVGSGEGLIQSGNSALGAQLGRMRAATGHCPTAVRPTARS